MFPAGSLMSQMIVNAVVKRDDSCKLSNAIIAPYGLTREAVPGVRIPTTAGMAVASEILAGRHVVPPAIDILPNDRRQWECR